MNKRLGYKPFYVNSKRFVFIDETQMSSAYAANLLVTRDNITQRVGGINAKQMT